MNLNEIAIFVKVVEVGSFIGAANHLALPKSTVSARVTSLEKRLGVTLIRRTTRKLHVTDAGKDYYEHCVRAISQIEAAEEQVSQAQSKPHGLLKLTAPIELGATLLPNVLVEFNKKYPEVNVEVILTDRTTDLIAEGIDIGIRAGSLKDSSLISKKLGTVYFAPFASNKYLKSNKEPKSPYDLEHHCSIQFSALGGNQWHLLGTKEKASITIKKVTIVNDLNLIKGLAIAGLGVALLPTFLCYQEVKTGKLVRILPNWKTEPRPVHFIYSSQKFVTPKIKAFIEVATDILKKSFETAEL